MEELNVNFKSFSASNFLFYQTLFIALLQNNRPRENVQDRGIGGMINNRQRQNQAPRRLSENTYSNVIKFIGSLRLNIFLMIINLSFVFVLCHLGFLYHNVLEKSFLEWVVPPHNFNNINQNVNPQQQPQQNQQKATTILELLIQENLYYYLVIYWLIDHKNIYATFFDVLVFGVAYTFFSFTHCSGVIDTQISFSSALFLRKDENFQRRIKKVDNYFKNVIAYEILTIIILLWLFYYANILLLLLLIEPMNQALSYQATDDQIITKMHLNFFTNMSTKFLDLLQHSMIIFFAGISFGYFPMIQVYIMTQGYNQFKQFTQEIDKYRKFRNFLKNLNQDYPIVYFGPNAQQQNRRLSDVDAVEPGNNQNHQHSEEIEECAICKEQMNVGRKLSCNHSFHWFCIIQLIESGSKNCPICRAEFNNNNPNRQHQQNPGAQNNGQNSIMSFRLRRWLGRWMPDISIRMIRSRQAPVIPMNQAIERTEIRGAGGHIDQAILNITENIQGGMYPGVNI
ncbi:low quality protein: e3 ubiquitin-protein ligase amfr-like [Stylonychia lemnae]|uniref:Low quality protein: e3 ubiquitin-protein ligase amfr-like n=1 Tax=Stylonychia lemnae TaxID=5949 RepID=A0A078AYD4_STYLE|nr:low quality protein: e3 ubiquitin-protein ligase amfr-like [Stylonychia lemnae]|eukprot:CDW87415.1 low quality protein: e3 ubiquitin-protein ligase amfr-like [Stylonychia lemnae]